MRRIELPNYGAAIVADTVGFISHLPHQLVEAFRATLEETAAANLLLHVVDAANPAHPEFMQEVDKVLLEIEANHVPQLQIFNKIDLIPDCEPHLQRDENGKPARVWLSAKTGAGIELLLEAITELLAGTLATTNLLVDPRQTRLRSQLFANGFVQEESIDDLGFYHLHVKLPQQDLARLLIQDGISVEEAAPGLAGHSDWDLTTEVKSA